VKPGRRHKLLTQTQPFLQGPDVKPQRMVDQSVTMAQRNRAMELTYLHGYEDLDQ
jgi:hypothetical protein